jgi:amino acid transporter
VDASMVVATVLRCLVITVCVFCMAMMLVGFVRFRESWNEKTRDYWFGRMMWCIAGASAALEGILRHTTLRYSIVFFVVAGLVTLKGVLQKGAWGTPPDAVKQKADGRKRYVG